MKNRIILFTLIVFLTSCTTVSINNKESNTTNVYSIPTKEYGTDFDSTWGALLEFNGGKLPYDTLTNEQRSYINFPKLDSSKVYYVPKGKSYHSVDWCYTLARSKTIYYQSLTDSISQGLEPCSKCVE